MKLQEETASIAENSPGFVAAPERRGGGCAVLA
jgi:hypothetical protein